MIVALMFAAGASSSELPDRYEALLSRYWAVNARAMEQCLTPALKLAREGANAKFEGVAEIYRQRAEAAGVGRPPPMFQDVPFPCSDAEARQAAFEAEIAAFTNFLAAGSDPHADAAAGPQ